jgi:uncharacterized membrane protein
MHAVKTAIGGFAAGAALMYLTDPNRGRRRRAILRDKAGAWWRDVANEFGKAGRDLSNRAHGLPLVRESARRSSEAEAPRLEARVRSKIGRAVSHPHAIRASVEENGRVVLEGHILAAEVTGLLKAVGAAAGVNEVVNRLEAHDEPGDIASLQGGRRRRGSSELMQENWTPALRIGAGALAGLGLYGSLRTEGPASWAMAAGSAALLARAVVNKSMAGVLGMGDECIVHFDKTVHIFAPLREVFDFWSHAENFPRFMSHLKEVRDLGGNRSHWVAAGPGGVPVSWDAEITQFEPNRTIAWRSAPGSLVRTMGQVRFEDDAEGGTRLTIRMSYCPPAGIFGHIAASLFGADPKSEIDDDMVRLKSLLEIGKTRAHGETVWREQVGSMGPRPAW